MKRLLFAIIFVNLIWADGGVIPPPNSGIYGADQVALIKILPDSEELSILVKFEYYADYNGFAWIVPLPSIPTVSEVDDSLFINLSMLSGTYQYYGGCYGSIYSYGMSNDYFQVIEYRTIGFLETVLIQTDRADSLAHWLINNGYSIPEGMDTMFQDYIDRHWQYFFIARADTGLYAYGDKTGISLKFATDTIVYPMKISSLTSNNDISLYLYIIGKHKMFFDNAELLYANRISEKELAAIEEDLPYLFNYIKEGDYITKLRCIFETPSQMTSDIIIYQSPDDIEYRAEEKPSYWYFGFANSILLPFLLYTLYLVFLKIRNRKNYI